METRSIAIGLIAVVAAFAAAFGMAKSGGSDTENAGAGVKAETIKVAAPDVSGVTVGGTLPALKAERKPAKKKAKKQSSGSSDPTASAPSTSNSADSTESTSSAPAPTNTQPSAPAPSNPQPSNPAPSQPSRPAPTNNNNNGPVSGGGEDG